MVKMEREVGHVQSAMQHVETVAAGVQAGEVGSKVKVCVMVCAGTSCTVRGDG